MIAEKRHQGSVLDFLRDIRVLQIVGQIIFGIIVVAALAILWTQIFSSLEAKNLTPNFDFLESRSGFVIAEHPDWYTTNSTYGQAFLVGVINTLRAVSIGLVLATILGIFIGIFLLSRNWLIRNIARAYVELLRNTPLLVQLIFWYFVVMLQIFKDEVTIPNEGIAYIPLRYITYVLVLAGMVLYGRMSRSPSRLGMPSGAILAIILIELAYLITEPAPLLFPAVGFLFLLGANFISINRRGYLLGFGLLAFLQWLASAVYVIFKGLSILPDAEVLPLETYPVFFISNKGFVMPEILPTARFNEWLAFAVLGLIVAFAIWVYAGRVTETTGRPIPRGWYAILSIVGFSLGGWFFVGTEAPPEQIPIVQDGEIVYMDRVSYLTSEDATRDEKALYSVEPFLVLLPEKPKFRFTQGTQVTPEYTALVLGLVIYTSAFIAEIVRAGIQAVPYGQTEAARALGLSQAQTLRMIILPQALRVIIPPLGNQYLNLAKNSSLATAIAYADTYAVGVTIMNQSGQSVTGFTLVMLIYLSMSLLISLFMNLVNSRFQLVTR